MKKQIFAVISLFALLASTGFLAPKNVEKANATTNYVVSTNGCSYMSSLPTTIYLDPVDTDDVRDYYASLKNISASERQGTNLLKNLRPILFEMNYLKYGGIGSGPNGGGVSYAYTITDRDWEHSPASSISGGTYNSLNNTITGYNHKTEIDADPYVHMLYVDYEMQPTTKFKKDASNPNFDKEHVWCQSRGFKGKNNTADGPAGTDMHHLIAGDSKVNQEPHNNNPYGFVDAVSIVGDKTFTAANIAGTAKHTSPNDECSPVFEPIDSSKGDIARAIFYMVARYNNYGLHNTISDFDPFLELANYATSNAKTSVYSTNTESVKMGILSDLLAWNKLDPVDAYEIHRNDLIYRNYQGNRNPFIDFPQWADYIWGTAALDGTNYNSTPTGSADPENDIVYYTGAEDIPATGVSLNETSLSIDRRLHSTVTLTATVAPANATNKAVTWTTSDNAVATVSDGVVTLLKAGNATIAATTVSGGHTATCSITVTDTTPVVTSVTLNKTEAEIDVSRANQVQLTATVNGTNNPPSAVTWESSNESFATVSNTGLVTAVAPGNVTITATSVYDNTKSASCTVTVIDSSIGVDTLTYSSVGVTEGTYTSWTNKTFTTEAVYAGNSAGGKSSIQLRSGTTSGSDVHSGIVTTTSGGNAKKVEISWHNDSDSGRTVTVYGKNTAYSDANDLYDASTRGTSLGTISKTSTSLDIEGDYAYIGIRSTSNAIYINQIDITWNVDANRVSPTDVSLDIGSKTIGMSETFKLTATFTPANVTNPAVTWTSSDDTVAIVDSEGNVTGIAPGTATITVDTQEKHFQDTCEVTVTDSKKFKRSAYVDGVPYKMYLEATGYFDGGLGDKDYFGSTSTEYSSGVDVYFETVGEYKRLYFYQNTSKKYIVAFLDGTYKDFGIKDESVFTDGETTIYEWKVNESGYIYATANGVQYTLGLKTGQTFTTFALNSYSSVNRFMLFEYTAESFAKDFLDNITCDNNGVNDPIFADDYTWNDFSLIYGAMNSDQKSILKTASKSETGTTIQKALAKYEYMAWKHRLTDFIDRGVTPRPLSSFDMVINSDSNITFVISVISLVTVSSIIYLSIRKKKHN